VRAGRKVFRAYWRWRRDVDGGRRARARAAIAGWLESVGLRVYAWKASGRGQWLYVYGLRGEPATASKHAVPDPVESGRGILSFVALAVGELSDKPVTGGLRTARGRALPAPTAAAALEALDAGLRRIGKGLT
jgi:hypothetical protein